MTLAMRSVFSSHVTHVGYDAAAGTLHVRYGNSGRTAVYAGVPADVAHAVMSAPSIGEALWRQVRGRYAHGYAKEG